MSEYESFKALSTRLKKKKLLRKPPFAAVSNEYAKIGKQLQRKDDAGAPDLYAALCYTAVARCQKALSVRDKEAANRVHAGFVFLENEIEDVALAVEWEEYVPEAIDCYQLAACIYSELKLPRMASALTIEMAELLQTLQRRSEASKAYQDAAALNGDSLLTVRLLLEASECEVLQSEYQRACDLMRAAIAVAEKLPSLVNSLPHQHSASDLLPSFPVAPTLLMNLRTSLLLVRVLQGRYADARAIVALLMSDASGDTDDGSATPMRVRWDTSACAISASTGFVEMLEHMHIIIAAAEQRDAILVSEVFRTHLHGKLDAKQCALLDLIVCGLE